MDLLIPFEIITHIASFADFDTQRMFQQTCTRLRKDVKIKEIPRELHARLTDEIVQRYPYLESLCAKYNDHLTRRCLKYLHHLKYLNAFDLDITDDDIVGLPLEELHIQYCANISDTGLRSLSNLRKLDISHCWQISDESVSRHTNLTHIWAGFNNHITDKGISRLRNIRYLKLRNNDLVTDKSIKMLKKLRALELVYCNNITPDIRRSLPGLIELRTSNCARFDDQF